ncbi:hypothetical protein [Flavobacterium silvisoli]|nr:hypothetical protein [Flavobacterium silvisoli]
MIEKRIQKSLENNDRKEISFLQQKAKLLQLEKTTLEKEYKKLTGTNNR